MCVNAAAVCIIILTRTHGVMKRKHWSSFFYDPWKRHTKQEKTRACSSRRRAGNQRRIKVSLTWIGASALQTTRVRWRWRCSGSCPIGTSGISSADTLVDDDMSPATTTTTTRERERWWQVVLLGFYRFGWTVLEANVDVGFGWNHSRSE